MQGIYLITNTTTNQQYVGQSTNINGRWSQHKNSTYRKLHYNTSPALYEAIDQYGLETFDFTVLEIVNEKEKLNEREKYWILLKNTLYPNGYNKVLPLQYTYGELNSNAKLTQKDVDQIVDLLQNSTISIQDIANSFNVEKSAIYRINKGETWNNQQYHYPLRIRNDEARPGAMNGRSKITDEEVIKLRQEYVNKTVDELYIEYKDKYSFSGFKKIIQGATFTHLPIYKKLQKKWIYPENK